MKKYLVISLLASISFANPKPEDIIECDNFWLPRIANAKAAHKRALQRCEERKYHADGQNLSQVATQFVVLVCDLNYALDFCFHEGLKKSKKEYSNLL